jgi:nitrogen fixation protein FixH
MFAVVMISLKRHPQLTSSDYYAEGFNLLESVARKSASEATGWQLKVRPLPPEKADMPLVELTVTDKTGSPCDSLTGQIGFYRPSDAALDIESAPFIPIGTGKYLIKIPRPLEHGSWQAIANLNRQQSVAELRVGFFVE